MGITMLVTLNCSDKLKIHCCVTKPYRYVLWVFINILRQKKIYVTNGIKIQQSSLDI